MKKRHFMVLHYKGDKEQEKVIPHRLYCMGFGIVQKFKHNWEAEHLCNLLKSLSPEEQNQYLSTINPL